MAGRVNSATRPKSFNDGRDLPAIPVAFHVVVAGIAADALRHARQALGPRIQRGTRFARRRDAGLWRYAVANGAADRLLLKIIGAHGTILDHFLSLPHRSFSLL